GGAGGGRIAAVEQAGAFAIGGEILVVDIEGGAESEARGRVVAGFDGATSVGEAKRELRAGIVGGKPAGSAGERGLRDEPDAGGRRGGGRGHRGGESGAGRKRGPPGGGAAE